MDTAAEGWGKQGVEIVLLCNLIASVHHSTMPLTIAHECSHGHMELRRRPQ